MPRILAPAMKATMFRSLRLAALALLVAGSAHAQLLQVTDLGSIGETSYGTAIASNGRVAGFASVGGVLRPFSWHDGAATTLDLLPGHSQGWATAINASGTVVGYCDSSWVTPHGIYGITHMCQWNPGSTEAVAITCPGAYGGYASSINDAGAIVGQGVYPTATTTTKRGWKGYTGTNSLVPDYTIEDTRGTFTPSTVWSVNQSGDVAGWGEGTLDGVDRTRGFVQGYDGQPYDPLLAVNPNTDTWAHDLNDAGDVAGALVTVYRQNDNVLGGFIYDHAGTYHAVAPLPNDESSNVFRLNNSLVAVGASWPPFSAVQHPFIYQNGQTVDPNTILLPGSGWTILEVKDLDDAGHFVGTATQNGQTHAVLLTMINVTGVGPAAAGAKLAFSGSRPSPLRGTGSLSFSLPKAGHARMLVFDVSGRVRRTFEGDFAAGSGAFTWDSRDNAGALLEPGVYLARLESAGASQSRRVVIAR
jgi:hypothetical protein